MNNNKKIIYILGNIVTLTLVTMANFYTKYDFHLIALLSFIPYILLQLIFIGNQEKSPYLKTLFYSIIPYGIFFCLSLVLWVIWAFTTNNFFSPNNGFWLEKGIYYLFVIIYIVSFSYPLFFKQKNLDK